MTDARYGSQGAAAAADLRIEDIESFIGEDWHEQALLNGEWLARFLAFAAAFDERSLRYTHASLAPEIADCILRKCHERAFCIGLCLPLDQKLLACHMFRCGYAASAQHSDLVRLLALLERLVPNGVMPQERRLFIEDLSVMRSLAEDAAARRDSRPGDLLPADVRILRILRYTTKAIEAAAVQSVQLLASRLGTSAKHLGYLFRQRAGVPFHTFWRRERIKRAALELITSEANIQSISAAVGYSDVSNFYRDFHLIFDTTPSAYRLQKIDRSIRVPYDSIR